MTKAKPTTLVATETLSALAKGLLQGPEARLVLAVLSLSQHEGQYTGDLVTLSRRLQADFKQTYTWLKKAERVGILATEQLPYDEELETELRKITVLPPSSWLT